MKRFEEIQSSKKFDPNVDPEYDFGENVDKFTVFHREPFLKSFESKEFLFTLFLEHFEIRKKRY